MPGHLLAAPIQKLKPKHGASHVMRQTPMTTKTKTNAIGAVASVYRLRFFLTKCTDGGAI